MRPLRGAVNGLDTWVKARACWRSLPVSLAAVAGTTRCAAALAAVTSRTAELVTVAACREDTCRGQE